MARPIDEHVRPVAFLMNYTGKLAIICEPGCGRSSAEALDTTKGSILKDNFEEPAYIRAW
jgi:hypothetical protein